MSETWLKEDSCYEFLNIDAYQMFNCNRINKMGGGVLLYVSDLLTCKVNISLTFTVENCFEVVTVELSLNNNQKINVACLYRTPNSDITEFNLRYSNFLEEFKNKKLYVCGDINIDLMKHDTHMLVLITLLIICFHLG